MVKYIHRESLCIVRHDLNQGQGIGSTLIKDCIEHAKKHNVRKIFLWVSEKNYNARKVYEKFGFKSDDVSKFEVQRYF